MIKYIQQKYKKMKITSIKICIPEMCLYRVQKTQGQKKKLLEIEE